MVSDGAHFVHQFDPVILELWGARLYYYGLAYSLGFLGIFAWLRLKGSRRDWPLGDVYDFVIIVAASILVFGRAFEILVYEWDYYKAHLSQLLSYWRGGMASHGVLLGSAAGIWLFSRLRRRSFVAVADGVVIPAAFFFAIGRIGNFTNGEIVGTVTDVAWAVKFPDVEGFRHPVALYESLKNFLIIPVLLLVARSARPGDGKLMCHFIFWYGFLRLFTDHFRDYGTSYLGIGAGQYFNLLMAILGLSLVAWFSRVHGAKEPSMAKPDPPSPGAPAGGPLQRLEGRAGLARLNPKRLLLAALLLFYLFIPSSWTRGVLKEYRALQSSWAVEADAGSAQAGSD
jgi:phosphatidylglycerol:prolipoprotein diacylglycerol transferase